MTKQELQRLAGIPHLPTDLTYELRLAVSGEGPRAYDWSDKPHRLLWDACAALERAEERISAAEKLIFAAEELLKARAFETEIWKARAFELEELGLAERQACVEICRDVARDRALVGDRDGASAASECAETIRGDA